MLLKKLDHQLLFQVVIVLLEHSHLLLELLQLPLALGMLKLWDLVLRLRLYVPSFHFCCWWRAAALWTGEGFYWQIYFCFDLTLVHE